MQSNELERVATDLSSIRAAMRLDKPYTRADVIRDLATSLGGLLAMTLILASPLPDKPAFLLGVLPAVLYHFHVSAQQRRRRATAPAPWKEEKLTMLAMAAVVPLVIVWLAWSRLVGSVEAKSAGAAAVYFVGVGLGVLGIVDPQRRRYLAGSLVLIAYGLALPSLTPHETFIGASLALLAGGLLSAGITLVQSRSDGNSLNPGEAKL